MNVDFFFSGGNICECYDDSTNGHWTGDSCDACVHGWGLPFCTICDPGNVWEVNTEGGFIADRLCLCLPSVH